MPIVVKCCFETVTFVDLCFMLQSKKKGLSAEEKRTRMMEIFFETVGHPQCC